MGILSHNSREKSSPAKHLFAKQSINNQEAMETVRKSETYGTEKKE